MTYYRFVTKVSAYQCLNRAGSLLAKESSLHV